MISSEKRPLGLIPAMACVMVLLALYTGTGFAAQDSKGKALLEKTLDNLEKRYSGKSFFTRFTQASTLSALEITETASGEAWFSHPGKMKWRYLEPEQHEIITNGRAVWIFRPEQNQVMTGDAESFFKSGSGGAFLSDIGRIRQDHEIHLGRVSDKWVELRLTPKNKTPDIHHILIRVARDTHDILGATTVNAFDDATRFEFSRIRFEPLPSDLFEFKPPKGVDIIEMN